MVYCHYATIRRRNDTVLSTSIPTNRVEFTNYSSRPNATIYTTTPRPVSIQYYRAQGLLRRQNTEQLAHLRAWVGEVAGARGALIGGDFNAHERSSHIAQTQRLWLDTFRHLHPHADGTTHELRWPGRLLLGRRRLDYIFLHPGERRWSVLEARHVDAPGGPHSDHRAVLARLAPEF